MCINTTTRQQISVYLIMILISLLLPPRVKNCTLHFSKSGGTKIFFPGFARESRFVPPTFKTVALPLHTTDHARRLSQHARRNAWICSLSVSLSVHALRTDLRQLSTASDAAALLY